jgi:heme exporter protein B
LSSGWAIEIGAVFGKEIRAELRGRSALMAVLLFDVAAVVAAAFASSNQKLNPGQSAAILWVILLFASVVSLPRTFIAEEEQGTGDLLRLTARPHAVFWGKALYNLAFLSTTGALLSFLYFGLIPHDRVAPFQFGCCLLAGGAALSGVVSLCGALVAQASHRTILAGAIAVPLLIPLLALAVSGTQSAFGAGLVESGWRAAGGLGAFAVASHALGPYLFAWVWKG